MQRRDWAGTVLVSSLVALAALFHNHAVAAAILLAVAIMSGCLIVADVQRERRTLVKPPTDPTNAAIRRVAADALPEGDAILAQIPIYYDDPVPPEYPLIKRTARWITSVYDQLQAIDPESASIFGEPTEVEDTFRGQPPHIHVLGELVTFRLAVLRSLAGIEPNP